MIRKRSFRRMAGSGYVGVHIILAEILDSFSAGGLLSQFCFWSEHESDDEGWFQQTQVEIQEYMFLSRHEQDAAKKKMTDKGILETKLIGLPSKLYYRINWDCLEDIVDNFEPKKPKQSRLPKNGKLEKSATYGKKTPTKPESIRLPESGNLPCRKSDIADAEFPHPISKEVKDLSLSKNDEKKEAQEPTLAEKVVEMLERKLISGTPTADDPALLAYLDAGLTFAEILASASWCAENRKNSFGYVMKRAAERRKEAASIGTLPPKADPKPPKPSPAHASHIEVQPEPVKRTKSVMPEGFGDNLKSMLAKGRGD